MVAHSLPLNVMLDDIFFQKRESCHNAWRGLRMTPLFGCICPNSPHKKKCDRVYNVVYNNSCLGEFNVPHPAPSSRQFRRLHSAPVAFGLFRPEATPLSCPHPLPLVCSPRFWFPRISPSVHCWLLSHTCFLSSLLFHFVFFFYF
jgi:hypothetical protein